jgi:Protein of unknown function (DUF1257)
MGWKKITCIIHEDAELVFRAARASVVSQIGDISGKTEPVQNGIILEYLAAEYLAGTQEVTVTNSTITNSSEDSSMSHLSVVRLQLKNKEALLSALRGMGYSPAEYNQPIAVNNMYGRTEGKKADIVVHQVYGQDHPNKTDLGFAWNGNEYELITDLWNLERLVPEKVSSYTQWLSANYETAIIRKKYGSQFEISDYRIEAGEIKFDLTLKEQISISM